MKRISAIFLLIVMILINTVPVLASKLGKPSQPDKPYEKVLAKNGNWYTERASFEDSSELVIVYDGKYETQSSQSNEQNFDMKFGLSEKAVLKGIYLPYVKKLSQSPLFTLKDDKGNVYGPFNTEATYANVVSEKSDSGMQQTESINYVFISENGVVLPQGKYIMNVSEPQWQVRNKHMGTGGAFLIKGINYSGYDRYMQKVCEWEANANSGEKRERFEETLGNKDFIGMDLKKYSPEMFEKPAVKKPAVLNIIEESLLTEVIINTFNNGKGAIPGIITIQDESGNSVGSFQSVGGTLGKVANGVWATIPNIILPAGNYSLIISNPDVVTYDKSGQPLFMATVTTLPAIRYDFTGTYNINIEAYKTSTLMGPVTGKVKAFSFENFELTVLDKDGSIELIGKYEGMPFSQGCEIVEETIDYVVAKFNFEADLSKLPYKAKIGAIATVKLTKTQNDKAKIDITGTGTYSRQATKEKGADYNTYSITAQGNMMNKDLPVFVATALGRAGGAGNIPGPDSPVNAVTGLLFPPFVGVIVHVIQELLRSKLSEPKKYTLEWYAKKYPGKTREQLAWIMLADAMGNTDEPDEADAISIGDNEKTGGADNISAENYEQTDYEAQEPEYEDEARKEESVEAYGDMKDSERQDAPKSQDTKSEVDSAVQQNKNAVPTQEQQANTQQPEPETLTLQTDHTGRTTTYVKDPQTGEWINPETGGALDIERYNKDVAPNFARDKKFIDEQRSKLEKGDTAFDRELRTSQEARKQAIAKEKYMDKLGEKYGTRDKEKLDKIITEKQQQEKESFEAWNKAAERYEYAEATAGAVETIADVAIDGLANVTGPAGKGIRAGYKVIKGVAGTAAEDGISVSSLASGAVKGGADALNDFVDNPLAKAGITVSSEVISGAISNGVKGAKEGLADGISKAVMDNVTDRIGGFGNEMSVMNLKNGKVRIAVKSGDKWIGKVLSQNSANKFVNKKFMGQATQSMAKLTGSALDEFGIKPYVTDPIKKAM